MLLAGIFVLESLFFASWKLQWLVTWEAGRDLGHRPTAAIGKASI
jgi:hypothetical protein